jgi:hypothetical protein
VEETLCCFVLLPLGLVYVLLVVLFARLRNGLPFCFVLAQTLLGTNRLDESVVDSLSLQVAHCTARLPCRLQNLGPANNRSPRKPKTLALAIIRAVAIMS